MKPDDPILLVKWHETANWLLDRVDSFPKNQRFIFGTRLADRTLGVLELLVEAAYSPRKRKAELLRQVNRDLAVLRWLVEWFLIACASSRIAQLHSVSAIQGRRLSIP